MRIRLRLLLTCLAGLVFVVGACSSSTPVATEDRAVELADDGNDVSPPAAENDASTEDDTDSGAGDAEESADDEDDRADADANGTVSDTTELEEIDGFGLGGSEQIGALLSDCEAGSPLACDVLFQLSDFDTDEETVALTCGGRGELIDGFCTSGMMTVSGELYFDDDSDGLETVIDLCVEDANMTACDFLFFRSGPGSEAEEIGGTCGGRVDVAVPDCRTFLPEVE